MATILFRPHYVNSFCLNIGSGNTLLPEGAKALQETMLTYLFCGTQLRPISQEVLKISVCKMSLKNTLANVLPPLSGPNELKCRLLLQQGVFVGHCHDCTSRADARFAASQ